MLSLSIADIISINRSCISGIGVSIALYSYANKYEMDINKKKIIKQIALVLLIYTLICLLFFNGMSLYNNSNNYINFYNLLSIIAFIMVIFLILTNL